MPAIKIIKRIYETNEKLKQKQRQTRFNQIFKAKLRCEKMKS